MNVDTSITKKIMESEHMTRLLGIVGWALQLFYSVVTLTALVALIINITKLAASGGNPQARSTALRNILISGISLSVLGGTGVVYAVLVGFVLP